MPVLLTADQAPSLADLLAQANQAGLRYTLPSREGARDLRIQGLGSLGAAGASEISFLSNPKLREQLRTTRAAAVVLEPAVWDRFVADAPAQPGGGGFVPVLCDAPYAMYALLAQWFDQHRLRQQAPGVHASAVVHPDARLGDDVCIGPFSVIERGARIGAGSRIGPHCVVGQDAVIGADCLLHARVTLYHSVRVGDRAILHSGVVLGADGFGFAPDPRGPDHGWVKIAQLGGVTLGNDVEIGANTTVDRGALDDTRIGHGVKLDNQIMIAHNVYVGDHTAMAACVGVAGSTRIGSRCTIGGAAMLSGHLELADDVHISGGTAITSSVSQPGRYTGVYPYADHTQWQKNAAVISQLGTLRRRLRQLEKNTD